MKESAYAKFEDFIYPGRVSGIGKVSKCCHSKSLKIIYHGIVKNYTTFRCLECGKLCRVIPEKKGESK